MTLSSSSHRLPRECDAVVTSGLGKNSPLRLPMKTPEVFAEEFNRIYAAIGLAVTAQCLQDERGLQPGKAAAQK